MSDTTTTSTTAAAIASASTSTATSKGTKIVKPGSEMDKNAFLKILAAELTNQDPTQQKDSTQYVSQMAQFTSMEQMANLNNTMSTNAANSLIGKGVVTNVKNTSGVAYAGIVRDVTNNSGTITLGVEVNNSDGTTSILDFNSTEIATVTQVPDYSMQNMSTNTALIAAASMIGKKGEFSIQDSSGSSSTITGIVKGIVKESGVLKLKVLPDGSSETTTVTLDTLVNLDTAE